MKYHIIPFGCQMNLSDTDRVKSVLDNMGFIYTENEEDADILGLIACSVRQRAIDRVYARISKWNKWKKKKALISFATGCILETDKKKLLKLFDILFPVTELNDLPDMLKQYGINTGIGVIPQTTKDNTESFWEIDPSYDSSFEAYVPIQNGCDKFCTYCAVPYTRGREVSRSSEKILNEISNLLDKNYKTITLLGQNVNSYGLDKKGDEISFTELLEKTAELIESKNKKAWVYFTSPHPRDMKMDVLEIMAKHECLAEQLHLPLQSGDDNILSKMNRKYTLDDYRVIVKNIRTLMPKASIFTDIIVGFTGETEKEFHETEKAMEEFKYNMCYIALYSPRPGSVSYKWEDDVDHNIKKQRHINLTEIMKQTSLEYNKGLLNKKIDVIIGGFDRKKRFLMAKTEGKIICRVNSNNADLIGTFQKVKITKISDLSIEGELV